MNRLLLILAALTLTALSGCVLDIGCRERGGDHRPHVRGDHSSTTVSSERK